MDFPAYRRIDVTDDLESKRSIVRGQDHKSVILQDATFEGLFKKGVVLTSSDSEDTYLFLDPVTGKRITLRYEDLRWLMIRAE